MYVFLNDYYNMKTRENRDIDGWYNSGADIKTKHETKCEPFKLMFDMTSWEKKKLEIV